MKHAAAFSSQQVMTCEQFGDPKAPKTAVFMHGMLGSRKNMRTPCREFVKRHPEYSCLTVDLRGHGDSSGLGGDGQEASIAVCADDLQRFLKARNISRPHMLLAHSMGGKVALKFLENCCHSNSPLPDDTWILDSLPMPYELEQDDSDKTQSVANVLEVVSSIPMPLPNRTVVIEKLTERGISLPIAQWLSTSLKQTSPNTCDWVFNLKDVKQLFDSFVALDMSPFLKSYRGNGSIHFVRAGKSKKWTAEVINFFDAIIDSQEEKSHGRKNIQLHSMPSAGHWLHSEDLPGLLRIIDDNYSV